MGEMGVNSIFRDCLGSKGWRDTRSSVGDGPWDRGFGKGLDGARVSHRARGQALQREEPVLLWGERLRSGRNTSLAPSPSHFGRVGCSRPLPYQAALWAEGPRWGPDAALSIANEVSGGAFSNINQRLQGHPLFIHPSLPKP